MILGLRTVAIILWSCDLQLLRKLCQLLTVDPFAKKWRQNHLALRG